MHLPDPSNPHPQSHPGKINILIHAVQRFASSYGLQPFQIIAVKDRAAIESIHALASGPVLHDHQAQILVFAIQSSISKLQIDDYLTGIVNRKKAAAGSLNSYNKYLTGTINNPDREGRSWAAKQVGLALKHLTTTATQLQVPVTILQGVNLAEADRILGFKEKKLHTVSAVTLSDTDDYITTLSKYAIEREQLFEWIQ